MATQPRLRQKQLGRDDPKTNWPEYNKGRSQEGELFIHWIMQMAISVREIMGMVPGTRDRRVSAILVSILKSKDRLSYWSMVSHFDKYPVYLERCELSMQYYTSCSVYRRYAPQYCKRSWPGWPATGPSTTHCWPTQADLVRQSTLTVQTQSTAV